MVSVSKWSYSSEKCDGDFCVGDCDYCSKEDSTTKNDECNKQDICE